MNKVLTSGQDHQSFSYLSTDFLVCKDTVVILQRQFGLSFPTVITFK